MNRIIIILSICLLTSCILHKASTKFSDVCDNTICILPGMSIDNLLQQFSNIDKQEVLKTEDFSFPVTKWNNCNKEDVGESNYDYLVKYLELSTDNSKSLQKVTYGVLYTPFDTSYEEYLRYTKKEMLNYFGCINSFEQKYNSENKRDSLVSNNFLFVIDKSDTTMYKVVIEMN